MPDNDNVALAFNGATDAYGRESWFTLARGSVTCHDTRGDGRLEVSVELFPAASSDDGAPIQLWFKDPRDMQAIGRALMDAATVFQHGYPQGRHLAPKETTMSEKTIQTLDGYMITTIEQDGKYAGEDLGRLWFKSPEPRTNAWTWYGNFKDEARRQAVIAKAQTLTFKDFDDWFDTDKD